jgi:hypothetical protein
MMEDPKKDTMHIRGMGKIIVTTRDLASWGLIWEALVGVEEQQWT